MTTSGTYVFAPSLGELVLNAFARIKIRRAELTEEHLQNSRMMANLLLADWSVHVPNLWTVDTVVVPLDMGVATYDVPTNTVAILDAYVSLNYGTDTQTDLIIYPVSRTEYASFPQKEQQGRPTVFWWDRLINSTLTLWVVPDQAATYTLTYYRVRQIQDANYTSGQNVEIPYRFLEAFASGLAAKLSEIYAPDMTQQLEQRAERYWLNASQQDAENTPLYLMPGLSGYFR